MSSVTLSLVAVAIVVPIMGLAAWYGWHTALTRLDPEARQRLLHYERVIKLAGTDPSAAEALAKEHEHTLAAEYEQLRAAAATDPAAARRFGRQVSEQLRSLRELERAIRGEALAPNARRSLEDITAAIRRLEADREWVTRLYD